ncbi:MAG TPA: hypothetical protein ENK84_02235 [Desulfobulbus sp.]|nr:hypothetical protein [Desulfobulbus sp.]
MEKLVAELKKLVELKEDIDRGDVVLIAAENPQMLAFAVITDIVRDTGRKDPWWHVSMRMLSVPLQSVTWTLRTEQMCGREIFTMGGDKRFMAPVRILPTNQGKADSNGPAPTDEGSSKKQGPGLRIVK